MDGRLTLSGGLAVAGALALLVGLSLDWYEPGLSAWTVFEVVDILLAAIAVGVVVVALARSWERPRIDAAAGWLPAAGAAALVLVLVSIVSPPPAAANAAPEAGAWLSLAGALLLFTAAVLATTEVSVVVTMRPRGMRSSSIADDREVADEAEWGEDAYPEGEMSTEEGPIESSGAYGSGSVEPLERGIDGESETRPLRHGD